MAPEPQAQRETENSEGAGSSAENNPAATATHISSIHPGRQEAFAQAFAILAGQDDCYQKLFEEHFPNVLEAPAEFAPSTMETTSSQHITATRISRCSRKRKRDVLTSARENSIMLYFVELLPDRVQHRICFESPDGALGDSVYSIRPGETF